jgi:integrase/recombinase XerC
MNRKLYVIEGNSPVHSVTKEEKLNYENQLINSYREVIPIHYAKDAVRNFNSALSNYIPWLRDNDLYIWEIKNKDYDSFAKIMTSNLKNSTVVHYNCLLANFYDWMTSRKGEEVSEKYGVRPVNPIDKWNTPQRKQEDELPELPDNDVVNYYFQKEKIEFQEALQNNDRRQIIIMGRHITIEQIMYHAGLRLEEVSNLDRDDIDLETMVGVVRKGKGNKDRIFDISSRLGPVLKWYLEQIYPLRSKINNIGSELPLFISERKQRIATETIQGRMWLQQEKYNIPIDQRFSPHGFRRLFATNLYMELFEIGHPDPLMYIKGQLGHVYLSTTLKYCRIPQSYISRIRFESIKRIQDELHED